MTEQHHEKSCNINNIMARFTKTGVIDHINRHQANYGDVTGADFKAAQDLVAEQKSVFHELPAAIREQFDNDPANYLDLMMTDEGVEELREMLNPTEPTPEPEPEPEPEPTPEPEPAPEN